jgi:hypothetical protein
LEVLHDIKINLDTYYIIDSMDKQTISPRNNDVKINNYTSDTNKRISITIQDQNKNDIISPVTNILTPNSLSKLNNYASNELLYKDFHSFRTTGTTEVTYQMISDILKNTYNFEESITSTALDILGLYLKGQKILYTESKTLCEKRLHTLMLPAICISAISIVLSLLLREYQISSIVLSILSVINSIILSLVTYLKLDAKAEAHKISAYKYQKLESLCEFKSGRVLIFKDIDDIANILTEIETKVMEIKESNQFILPEYIRHSYPIIYSTNVFSLVKKIQNKEIILINNLKLVIKKILEKSKEKYTLENTININENRIAILSADLEQFEKDKNKAFTDVISFREKYLEIDKIFNDEMNKQMLVIKNNNCCCGWLKS